MPLLWCHRRSVGAIAVWLPSARMYAEFPKVEGKEQVGNMNVAREEDTVRSSVGL